MSDRDELVELMARYASIPDTRDWIDLPRTVFTDPFAADFESLSGQPEATAPRAAMMAATAATFTAFAVTHQDNAHLRAVAREAARQSSM